MLGGSAISMQRRGGEAAGRGGVRRRMKIWEEVLGDVPNNIPPQKMEGWCGDAFGEIRGGEGYHGEVWYGEEGFGEVRMGMRRRGKVWEGLCRERIGGV